LYAGFFLLISSEEPWTLFENIFTIIISLMFVAPLVTSVFDMKPPKETIAIFVIGGMLFVGYSLLMFRSFSDFFGFFLETLLYSSVSVIAVLLIKKLHKIVPP